MSSARTGSWSVRSGAISWRCSAPAPIAGAWLPRSTSGRSPPRSWFEDVPQGFVRRRIAERESGPQKALGQDPLTGQQGFGRLLAEDDLHDESGHRDPARPSERAAQGAAEIPLPQGRGRRGVEHTRKVLALEKEAED